MDPKDASVIVKKEYLQAFSNPTAFIVMDDTLLKNL
jgi:hypothetical protein